MTDLRKLLDAATKGPWDYDTTMTEGEYGDGGPDSHVGFKQFVIVNENGDTICDTTNRDGSLVEVVEHLDGDGWDARDVLGEHDAALIVAAVNALPALLNIVEAAKWLQEWEDRATWLSANRPAFGSEPIYTTWWRASTKHDAARPAIVEALTAALAQWEKQ